MSANGRNRGYIGRNETASIKGIIDSRQSYLNEELRSYNYGTDWSRPADWLPIPGYTFGEQVAYGLLAITDDEEQSNSVGLAVAGNYLVDWGDGSTGSFSSGAVARRIYQYSSIPSNTLTTEGFKQVLITVRPQSGQNLTSLNFASVGITWASAEVPSKWLEFNINAPNCTTFTLRPTTTNPWLRNIFINRMSSSSGSATIGNLPNLESLYFPPNFNPGNGSGLYFDTPKLKSVPFLNITGALPIPQMFQNAGIEVLPNYNYSFSTSIDSFANASDIKSIPFVFDISSHTSTSVCAYFANCVFLEYVKGVNAPNTNSGNQMFVNCVSLKEVGGVTLSKTTTLRYMFNGCRNLEKIGSFDGGTGIQSIEETFGGCRNLKTAPQLDLRNCTNGYRAFTGCRTLENVPGYTFGPNANLQNMFGGCYSLKKLPEMDFRNVRILDTGAGSGERFTFGCFALERFPVKNLRVSWNLSNSRFGFTALSEIFAGLSGASGGSATLNITGNPGATFITPAQIAGATALGWTITR